MLAAIWSQVKDHRGVILDLSIAVFGVLLGFGLGRLSRLAEYREPVRIIRATTTPEGASGGVALGEGGEGVVASKTGTKYHYAWCAGAARISGDKKVVFASIAAARAAGYTPAANCPGLE